MAANNKSTVFWNVTPCSLAALRWHFTGVIYLDDGSNRLPPQTLTQTTRLHGIISQEMVIFTEQIMKFESGGCISKVWSVSVVCKFHFTQT